jgi:poly-gamma-glutamate synthesis protein (capsule biosynthesis protein)
MKAMGSLKRSVHPRKTAILAAVTVSLLVMTACSSASQGKTSKSKTSSATASQGGSSASATPTQPTKEAKPTTIHIVSSGDMLFHLSLNEAAKRASGGQLDYSPLVKDIQPYIKGADLGICALEVPVAPPGEAMTNYPTFGTSKEIAPSLKKMGWDGCATATNHTMDRGFPGVKATLDALDSAGLGHAGTARTAKEADQTQYYTLKVGERKVKVASLAATTLTNGMPIPEQQPWSWNVVGKLGHRSIDDVIADAKHARQQGADLVVLSMHWGTEYVSQPIPEQKKIAAKLAKSGQFDLVFGDHSHVPEPVAKLDGGPENNGMWLVWSMGNTISGQGSVAVNDPRVASGLLMTASVQVPAQGRPKVTKLDWMAMAEDMTTEHVYPLRKLEKGYKDQWMTMSPAEIKRRGEVTYPVMKGGAERTAPPQPASELVGQERK